MLHLIRLFIHTFFSSAWAIEGVLCHAECAWFESISFIAIGGYFRVAFVFCNYQSFLRSFDDNYDDDKRDNNLHHKKYNHSKNSSDNQPEACLRSGGRSVGRWGSSDTRIDRTDNNISGCMCGERGQKYESENYM